MSSQTETKKRTSKQELEQSVQHYTNEYQEKQENYRSQNGKTAAAVLDLCQVVFEASTALTNKKALKSFKEQNKLQDKGTFSQYRTIGQHYDRLRPHASSLPSSWYTLYRIAKLDPESFASAIGSGKLHAFTTQRDVRELSGTTTPRLKKSDPLCYIVELTETDANRVQQFDAAMKEFALKLVAQKFVVTIDKSEALEKMLTASSSLKTAA